MNCSRRCPSYSDISTYFIKGDIMTNLENMDGLAFEKLIYNLFVKLGFRAQITKASGDGGIDIIANHDGLVFKGTYLIQCKRWKSKVGEPELRDLYGTVISENALKGILVTTSSFSRQAEEFSRGKNLELIDGPKLKELLELANLDNTSFNMLINSAETNGFLQSPLFDSEKYQLLTGRINNDPTLEIPHTALINMLMDSVLEFGSDARTNGLIHEATSRITTYNQIFASGKMKVMKERRSRSYYYLAMMELANANYGKAYEYLLKIELAEWGQILTFHRCYIAIAYILGFDKELDRLLKEAIKGVQFRDMTIKHPTLIIQCNNVIFGKMKPDEIELEYPVNKLIKISDFLYNFKIPRETIEQQRAYVRSFGKIDS